MPSSFLTQEGYDKLQKELDYLRSEKRQEVAERLREALDGSPLGVDADVEVESAKNAQAFVEGRIQYLKDILAQAKIVDTLEETDVVQIGTRVTIKSSDGEKETYTVVGRPESDPTEGKISNESPLGSSLLGHSKGDEVDVLAPGGVFKVKILDIG
ncbi:MAG: transcription elongation factor GreA [Anaerolineales bacterium]|nr:transcription elongation factor GreA [Anaerolineales bacterium]